MKIKTRNFLISFLMLLTLVFGVFAFMPKTTMTASAGTGIREITEIDIRFYKFPTTVSQYFLGDDGCEVLSIKYSDGGTESNSRSDFPVTTNHLYANSPNYNDTAYQGDTWVQGDHIYMADHYIKRITNYDPEFTWYRRIGFYIPILEQPRAKFADNVIINIKDVSSNIQYKTTLYDDNFLYPNTVLVADFAAKPLIPIEKVELEIPSVADGGTLRAPIVITPNVKLGSYDWSSDTFDNDSNSKLTVFVYPKEGYCFYVGLDHPDKMHYDYYEYESGKKTTIYINGEKVQGYHTAKFTRTYARVEYYYNNKITSVDVSVDEPELGVPLGVPTTTNPNVTIRGYGWTPNRTPEGGEIYTLTVIINTNTTYEFSNTCNITVNGQTASDVSGDKSYKRIDFVFHEDIKSASITVPEPVAGQTPADVKGTLNTEGLTINKETWYEVNGSSLDPMDDTDVFVAGKQYRYEAFVASTVGYQLASDFYLKINESFASGNGGLWKMKTPVTAKTIFSAEAVKNEVTVIKGDTVTLKVNATGDGLEYVWQGDETVGAPSVGVNFRDNITLECVNAGTYTYKCIVKDANGNRETVTFAVTVIAPNMSGTVLPAEPVFNGEGFIGVEDSDNITVTKNGSIVLKPDFTFGNSGAIGEISYTWEIYDASYKRIGKITTENLVITADSEIINSKTVGTYVIMLTIGNKAGDVHESMFTGATVYVVEPESTGNLGGQIGAEQEQASPYAMRKMSARSAENFEGTIVYLMKDEAIAYVTEANAEGYYMFTNIPYGSYSVKVEKEGYEDYNKPVEVNAEEVTHDVTIILHVCFADEGMEISIPAREPSCEMGEVGNIECRSCIACGKVYDMDGNLLADSAADPYSVNDMGIPYVALLYPVHDYCGEAQEGGNADQYLRHRAETCLEETTYWHYCIYCHKSAGDDPSAVDKYYVGSASNQTHSYTLEIADEYYFYQGGETCKDKIWYYHACEYCYEKGNTVWESNVYGAHAYGDLIPAQAEIHTKDELKAGVAAHYFCEDCNTYFDENYVETTLEMLTGAVPAHTFVEGACECGATDPNYVPSHEHTFVEGKCECGETDPNYTPDSSSKDEGKKSGCRSTITGTSLGMLTLACAGAFVFLKKRKEN